MMSRRSISIEDIARAAGVSHSTVSRALRDSPLISVDVRASIRRLATEMGYTPNAIAQSLQGQRTNTVGLVVTTIADPYWADVVKGVDSIARAAQLSVFLSTSDRNAAQELAVIETFNRRRVDGILVADSRIGTSYADRTAALTVPTVLINGQASETTAQLHAVSVDSYAGAYQAAEYLLALGHRRIGYLGVNNRPRSFQRRLAGYHAALLTANITPDPAWVQAPASEYADADDVLVGQQLLPALLAAGVTAICCYNDMVAVGVVLACRSAGVAVPGQLSIVGFDDIQLAAFVTPALTTIAQPRQELGSSAMTMLLAQLAGESVQDQVLLPALVVRSSTASVA